MLKPLKNFWTNLILIWFAERIRLLKRDMNFLEAEDALLSFQLLTTVMNSKITLLL